MKKKFVFLTMLLVSAFIVIDVPVYTYASENSSISTYADRIEWRYTITNGVLYKRLYNYSKNIWIGDWIPA